MSNIPRYVSASANLANFETEVSVITSKMHCKTGSHNKLITRLSGSGIDATI